MVAGSGIWVMPAKAGAAEPASTRAATIKRSIDLILLLLLAADEALGEIGRAHTRAEQGHGRWFRHLNGNARKSRGGGASQHQGGNDKTIHRLHSQWCQWLQSKYRAE